MATPDPKPDAKTQPSPLQSEAIALLQKVQNMFNTTSPIHQEISRWLRKAGVK